MIGVRVTALVAAAIVFSTPVICAQDRPDLSTYREYRLGMTLAAVAKQAGLQPSDARVLHERPELVEELEWRAAPVPGLSAPTDSVRRILFSFHDGQLLRIAVSYDWDRTEGLTVEDMVEAISATYGLATLRTSDIVPFVSPAAVEADKLVAHWEDPQYALDLYRPSYASTFALMLFSKQLNALARVASVKAIEAILMDEPATPTRALARQRTQEAERHARQEYARRVNKAAFRP